MGISIFQGGSRPSAVEAVVNTVLTEAMLNISGSGGNSQPDQTDCVASAEESASLMATQEDNFRSVLEALDSALPQMLGMCVTVYYMRLHFYCHMQLLLTLFKKKIEHELPPGFPAYKPP